MFLPNQRHFLSRNIRGTVAFPAILVSVAISSVIIASALPVTGVRTTEIPSMAKTVEAVELSDLHRAPIMDRDFYDQAFAADVQGFAETPAGIRGLVLPHHLLAASLIARVVEAVAAKTTPERIVIVAPDHLGRSRYPAIVSAAGFETPYGIVRPDTKAVEALLASGVVASDEKPFEEDVSVSALMPFLKRAFLEAEVVAVMVNARLDDAKSERLAAALPADGKTLVIASVDFSHYGRSRVAGLHDVTAEAALASADVSGLGDLDVDSPQSLGVLSRTMGAAGAGKMTLLKRSDSAEIMSADPIETTSYVLAAFSMGAVAVDSPVTVLAVGDMMFDRAVRDRMTVHGADWPFASIRGQEDRFFRGVDVMTGNLEGAISPKSPPVKENDFGFDDGVAATLAGLRFDVVNLANNHTLDQGRSGADRTAKVLDAAGLGHVGDQVKDDLPPWTTVIRGRKVALLGFDAAGREPDEPTVEGAVRAAKSANDLVIVSVHWGDEYKPLANGYQREFGRKLVEWGADAVLGTHPHVVEGMEVWQGKPIFWSLGNFIFDQDWSAETKQGLAVGLAFREKGIEVRLFPIDVKSSQPRLVFGEEEAKRLETFAARSDLDPALRGQAKKGIIEIGNAD